MELSGLDPVSLQTGFGSVGTATKTFYSGFFSFSFRVLTLHGKHSNADWYDVFSVTFPLYFLPILSRTLWSGLDFHCRRRSYARISQQHDTVFKGPCASQVLAAQVDIREYGTAKPAAKKLGPHLKWQTWGHLMRFYPAGPAARERFPSSLPSHGNEPPQSWFYSYYSIF